jgi:serine/threonine protein kinase
MDTNPQNLGKYELRELLRRGDKSASWKGFDPELRQYVTIKILYTHLQNDAHFITDFEHKVQTIALLHHPQIVRVRDFYIPHASASHGSIAYLVTDFVEGSTLADYIRGTSGARKYPSPIDIVRLFATVSAALDYAHQQGVIHRDIKPTNILLDKNNTLQNPMGEPVLTDFYNATLLGIPKRTKDNVWVDNPFYGSPEQAQGSPGNEFGDVYSLGVILYELCTGVLPFQGSGPSAIMMQHISATPTPPALIHANIPHAVTLVILRSLAKDPAARFASASSMTAALAEAFGIPVPEALSRFASSIDPGNSPTHYKKRQSNPPPGATPFSYELPIVRESTAPPPTLTHLQAAISPPVGVGSSRLNAQSSPMASAGSMYGVSPSTNSIEDLPAKAEARPSPGPALANTPPPTPRKRHRGLIVALAVLLIIVLIGSGLGSLYLLPQLSSINTSQVTPVVGQAIFLSSGQLSIDSAQGSNGVQVIGNVPRVNDELQITLNNILNPSPGKSYYAWLQKNKIQNQSTFLLLGKLAVDHDTVNFFFPGDSQHSDLLVNTSGILITEDGPTNPTTPSLNRSAWRYSVELPQIPSPGDPDHYSLVDYIRQLLSKDPTLDGLGLRGGLDFWLDRNTSFVLEWAGSARDYWKSKGVTLMRNHLIRILEYLDSAYYAQKDVPSGTSLNIVDQRIARVGLLEFDTHQYPSSYLYHIGRLLASIVNAPGVSMAQRTIATQTLLIMKNVTDWLGKVRQDAKQLIVLTGEQLLLPSSLLLLDDMTTQAFYAYAGHPDPSTNAVLGGVTQINYNLEHLASFDITQYKP